MTTNEPIFTVLLPIHRPPIYLPLSVASVLAQTERSLELLIVLDGAPDETFACATDLARRDPRIRVFRFPKGERHGEAHRATALESARGTIVTHIADDCLWLPDHLALIRSHAGELDFGHTLHCAIGPNDELAVPRAVLDDPAVPQAMLDGLFNIANFSDAFYTLEAYRRLPEGWAPAPTEVFTDLNMWRKFLRQDLRIGTIYLPSALFFSYPPNFSDEQSRAQIERWLEKISRVDGAARLREAVMRIHAAARRESLVGVDVDRTLSDALRQCARLRAQIGLLAAEHAAMQERAARIDQARQTQLDELSAENAELRERATRAEEASEVHLHSIRYRVGDALIRGLRPSKETLAIPARLLALLVEGVRKKKTR